MCFQTDQKPVLSGEEQERKITTYEGAMMKIKDATGVSDIRVSARICWSIRDQYILVSGNFSTLFLSAWKFTNTTVLLIYDVRQIVQPVIYFETVHFLLTQAFIACKLWKKCFSSFLGSSPTFSLARRHSKTPGAVEKWQRENAGAIERGKGTVWNAWSLLCFLNNNNNNFI